MRAAVMCLRKLMTLFKLFTRESCPMKLVPRPVGLEAKALHLPMSRRRQEAALLEHPAADPQDPIRAPPLQYEPFERERERERARERERERVWLQKASLCSPRLQGFATGASFSRAASMAANDALEKFAENGPSALFRLAGSPFVSGSRPSRASTRPPCGTRSRSELLRDGWMCISLISFWD